MISYYTENWSATEQISADVVWCSSTPSVCTNTHQFPEQDNFRSSEERLCVEKHNAV